MVYKKECVVCGTEFFAKRNNARYCDKHKKNGARILSRMERKQEKDRIKRENNKLASYHCELCGREDVW